MADIKSADMAAQRAAINNQAGATGHMNGNRSCDPRECPHYRRCKWLVKEWPDTEVICELTDGEAGVVPGTTWVKSSYR